MRSQQHIRRIFLLFTVAFAAFGLSLQASLLDKSGFKVSGVYRSEVPLEKETLHELEELAASKVFRDSVGAEVQIAPADGGAALRVTSTVQNEADIKGSHKFAVNLLSRNLKRTVIRHKNRTLQFLGADGKALSDPARRVVLKEQIAQLESFLKDGTRPQSVPLTVDLTALENAERNLQSSGETNTAPFVRATRARQELERVERELATAYLEANRLELESLSKTPNASSATPNEELELARRAEELTLDIINLENAPDLKLEGELQFTQASGRSQAILILCWVAALFSLLLALFYTPSLPPAPPVKQPFPPGDELAPAKPVALSFRMDWSDLMPGIVSRHGSDKADGFFHDIYTEMEHYLGRAPRRFLVLGDSPIESRLAFSLRLAHSLSHQVDRVRLIDFDLGSRRLSKRLGRQNLPGVGDLLVEGGPVEEFFSSIAGTHVQFAPAGCTRVIEDAVDPLQFERIMGTGPGEVCVIDASSTSPLHLVVRMIDVVLCTTQSTAGLARSQRETQVLVAFRDAGLPVWGVSPERNQFFPLL